MNKLQEATNVYLLEGAPIVKKWNKKITEVNTLLKEDSRKPLSLEKQTALAKILENTSKRIAYELRESTQNTMVGPYKKYALDVITGMFPNVIAMDLVNVQPIENKMGIINYVKYSAGSNKAPHKVGDEFASTFNYVGSDKNYTAQECLTQPVTYNFDTASNTMTLALPWKPVTVGSAKITLKNSAGSPTIILEDKGDGTLAATTGSITSAAIDYGTGIVTVVATGLTDVQNAEAAWYYNNEYAPVNVPEINLSIESIPVLAHSRKLKALWSFDASYELQKEYGQDLNALLAAQASAEIAHEIDMEIMDDLMLYAKAAHSQLTWSAIAPQGVSQAAHFESLKTVFNTASNLIFQKTKRAMGNFAVVGTNVATVLESTPSFTPSDLGNNIGPYYLGQWGSFKVYKNPFYDEDEFLIGYKGNTLFDAGYCYAPYMPVATTQMLMLADFQGQQGWATSYGKTILNQNMYVSGKISGLV